MIILYILYKLLQMFEQLKCILVSKIIICSKNYLILSASKEAKITKN